MEQKLAIHSSQAFGLNSIGAFRGVVDIRGSDAGLLAADIHIAANKRGNALIVTATGSLIT